MSTEGNKAAMRRIPLECFNQGNLDVAFEERRRHRTHPGISFPPSTCMRSLGAPFHCNQG